MEGWWRESSSGRVQGGGTRAWQQVRTKAVPSQAEDRGLDRWGARWEKAKEGVQVSCGVTGWMGGPFTKEGIDSGKGTA